MECVEQGEDFPAEPDEVEADKVFQFYLYPFAKMGEQILKVKANCTSPTFTGKIARRADTKISTLVTPHNDSIISLLTREFSHICSNKIKA